MPALRSDRPLLATLAVAALLACGHAATPDHAAEHPGAEHARHEGGHRHDFSDVERFAAIFDDPARDEWQRPGEVVALLDAAPGMIVADLGAGTGYFEPHLARAVGGEGRVLALDVEPTMVAHMRERFAEAGLANVEARRVAPDDPGLARHGVDRILIVDTWHHIAHRERYAAKLRDGLRPGGSVLVVDFTSDSPHGPPEPMRLPAAAVAAELAAGGLAVEILSETLPFQYAVRGRAESP